MEQKNYEKAQWNQRRAEKVPSKEHVQPIVQTNPKDGKPLYREEQ